MNGIKEVLMNRDGLTEQDANEVVSIMREEFYEIAETGGSLDDVEDLLYGEGLELDYIFDLF